MSQHKASRWLAAELKGAAIKQASGRAIDASAIARWGAEQHGKSLKGSDWFFATFVLGAQRSLAETYPHAQSDNAPLTPQQAKTAAAWFIKLLKIAGF